MVVILLNGPPRSGKDTLANYIEKKHGHAHLQIKEILVQSTVKLFDISRELWDDKYESHKEVKLDYLSIFRGGPFTGGLVKFTPREALIYVSENVIKPVYGEGIFGKVIANRMETSKNYVISDSGFDKEVKEIVEKIGEKNVYLIKLSRRGCTYKNDSRNYLTKNSGVLIENTFFLYNDLSFDDLYKNIDIILNKIKGKNDM